MQLQFENLSHVHSCIIDIIGRGILVINVCIIQNGGDIMEAMEGIEDVTEETLSVKSVAKLLDSEVVCTGKIIIKAIL